MNVYLLRHGESEPRTEGQPDASRKLTEEGAKTIRNMLPGMKRLIEQVEYILVSPMERALATAGLIAEYYKCRDFIDIVKELSGPNGEERVCTQLNKLIGKDHLMIVGHEPHISALAAYLCGSGPETIKKLEKGGMMKIYIAGFPGPGEGKLIWTMTPEEIARG
jgi:phosphohistidine phosphatase